MEILIITAFKLTVATLFTIGLKIWFERTDNAIVALGYWLLGLLFVFLNLHGVLNGITQMITGEYLTFNLLNVILAFGVFMYIGLKYFNRL